MKGRNLPQIVVLTIPTLAGENLEEFSIKVAEAWKIGQKGLDNGAILLIAKQERKIRIEVGRGLEGKLTDLVSGRIIRGVISPKFKQGDFEGGIAAGVSAVMAAVRGEFPVAPDDGERTSNGAAPLLTLFLFLMGPVCSWGPSRESWVDWRAPPGPANDRAPWCFPTSHC